MFYAGREVFYAGWEVFYGGREVFYAGREVFYADWEVFLWGQGGFKVQPVPIYANPWHPVLMAVWMTSPDVRPEPEFEDAFGSEEPPFGALPPYWPEPAALGPDEAPPHWPEPAALGPEEAANEHMLAEERVAGVRVPGICGGMQRGLAAQVLGVGGRELRVAEERAACFGAAA